uniref:Uncharacterized protein n=1 Tax=Ditylenchus dipsaci TaxID=166011 RepID=A0A915E0D1_9BILA
MEIAKILLALFYAFRCSQPKELEIYVEELSKTHNIELANLVNHLQDNRSWHPRESWPAILKKQSAPFDSDRFGVTPISRSAKSSVLIPSTPKQFTAESRRQSSFFPSWGDLQGGSPETRNGASTVAEGSPIASVLNSPRGSDGKTRGTGREKDSILDMASKHENKIALLESENNKLNQKVGKLQKENEMIKSLQETVTDLQRDNSKLQIELSNLREGRNTKRELEASKKNLERANRSWKDEVDCHESLRKEFMALEQQFTSKEVQWQKENESILEELSIKERNLRDRLTQKDKELENQAQLSAQVSANYMEKIRNMNIEFEAKYNEMDKSEEWEKKLQQLQNQLLASEAGRNDLLVFLKSTQDQNLQLSSQLQRQEQLATKENESLSNEVAAKEEQLEMQSVFLEHLRSNHSRREDSNSNVVAMNAPLPSDVHWHSAMSVLDCAPSIQSSALSLESAISSESSMCPSEGYQEQESTVLFEYQLSTPSTNDRKVRGNRIVEHTPVKTRIATTTLNSIHSSRRLF